MRVLQYDRNMREGIMQVGLKDLIGDLPNELTMVEIGCFKGESTEMFLNSGKVNKLYAVDVWSNQRFQLAEEKFNKRFFTEPNGKVVKLKMTMEEAIYKIQSSVDFIYIDGNHTYEWVFRDILASLVVIKSGGIIAGHDYVRRGNVGVIQAVDLMLGKPDKLYKDSSWLKYMPV
jgi:predicted O-methyltransferase YrrM